MYLRKYIRPQHSYGNDKYYRYGSIYSGNKTVSSEWLFEKQATGVNAVRVKNETDAVVNIGWGSTSDAAKATQSSVAVAAMAIIDVSGSYIAWQGTGTGTILLEQSVIR